MGSKSVNISERETRDKPERQRGHGIERLLRGVALAGAAASILFAVRTEGAPLIIVTPPVETNTVSFSAPISLGWQPQAYSGQFVNFNASQTYNAFDRSRGTLNTVNWLFTVSYNAIDQMFTDGSSVQVQIVLPLPPIVQMSSGFPIQLATNSVSMLSEQTYLQPAAVFDDATSASYQVTTQTGVLNYAINLTPSDFSVPVTINYSLPNSSASSPYAPVQNVVKGVPDVNFISKDNLNEVVSGGFYFVYTPYTIPSMTWCVPAMNTNLVLSTYFLDFGSVGVGSTATNVVTLSNVGSQPVTLSQVNYFQYPGVTNDVMANIDFKISGVNDGDTLAPGGSEQITVICGPKAIALTPNGTAAKLQITTRDTSGTALSLHDVSVTPK